MNSTIALILLTIALLALVDYIPRLFVAVKKSTPVRIGYTRIPDYRIIATVYGDISYLQNADFLKKYADKTVIATSKYETKQFYTDLRKMCRRYGLRYVTVSLPHANGKPIINAYTIYAGVFADLRKIHARKQTPCVLIDADTFAVKNVNNLVRAFISSKHHLASLRCEASNPQTTIAKIQAFEYGLAMDNRKMDPWLTSGACNIATAGVYKRLFARHSNFFAGGDIEIGKIAAVSGMNVGHIDFTFYTAVPETFEAWFKQRIIWFAGGFRHHVTNIGSYGWHHFFMLFYNSLLIYLLLPVRWVEIVNYPLTMLGLLFISYLYIFLFTANMRWRREFIFLPFYGIMQSMIILPLAIGRYCKLAYRQRSLGLLRYDLGSTSYASRMNFYFLNTVSAATVIALAFFITESRIQYWATHGWIAGLL